MGLEITANELIRRLWNEGDIPTGTSIKDYSVDRPERLRRVFQDDDYLIAQRTVGMPGFEEYALFPSMEYADQFIGASRDIVNDIAHPASRFPGAVTAVKTYRMHDHMEVQYLQNLFSFNATPGIRQAARIYGGARQHLLEFIIGKAAGEGIATFGFSAAYGSGRDIDMLKAIADEKGYAYELSNGDKTIELTLTKG